MLASLSPFVNCSVVGLSLRGTLSWLQCDLMSSKSGVPIWHLHQILTDLLVLTLCKRCSGARRHTTANSIVRRYIYLYNWKQSVRMHWACFYTVPCRLEATWPTSSPLSVPYKQKGIQSKKIISVRFYSVTWVWKRVKCWPVHVYMTDILTETHLTVQRKKRLHLVKSKPKALGLLA